VNVPAPSSTESLPAESTDHSPDTFRQPPVGIQRQAFLHPVCGWRAEDCRDLAAPRPVVQVVDEEEDTATPDSSQKEKSKMSIQVGKKAPDFEAPSYHKGKFSSFELSDHAGHWVLLCFYPSDFTFV
jgi:peroxiredoxin (alkyl hydroperoxide reductase subunit C)